MKNKIVKVFSSKNKMAPDRIASWKLCMSALESANLIQKAHEVAHHHVIEREEVARIRLARADVFSEMIPHRDPAHQDSYARVYAEWETASEDLRDTMQDVNEAVGVALQKVQQDWYEMTLQEQREVTFATDL